MTTKHKQTAKVVNCQAIDAQQVTIADGPELHETSHKGKSNKKARPRRRQEQQEGNGNIPERGQ